jgi:hypothetical protein
MTNRLKAYIKRTVLASAKEYAYPAKRRTKESTYSAFRDYANGTDTGCWHDLIYTVDVFNMFNRYRSDVAAAIEDFVSECGCNLGDYADRNREYTYAAMLVACSKRRTIEQYHNDDKHADAAQFAIRFACEYLLSDVARDCGVDL